MWYIGIFVPETIKHASEQVLVYYQRQPIQNTNWGSLLAIGIMIGVMLKLQAATGDKYILVKIRSNEVRIKPNLTKPYLTLPDLT